MKNVLHSTKRIGHDRDAIPIILLFLVQKLNMWTEDHCRKRIIQICFYCDARFYIFTIVGQTVNRTAGYEDSTVLNDLFHVPRWEHKPESTSSQLLWSHQRFLTVCIFQFFFWDRQKVAKMRTLPTFCPSPPNTTSI